MAFPSLLLLILFSSFSSPNCFSYAETDTLKPGQLLRDWEQLISAGKVFRLGFFNPNPESSFGIGSSGPRYVGIWFDQIPTDSVWVANRGNPVPDSSGALTIDTDGKLKITYQGGSPIVVNSGHAAMPSGGNFTATLLDSGNFVVRQVYPDGKAGRVLWQSFDYPHNVLLPGMKLGTNLRTGQNWTLTSWLSHKVPTPGAFQLGLDPKGTNQLLVWRRGEIYWSSGEMLQNGSYPSEPSFTWMTSDLYQAKFVSNKEERYFSYSVKYKSVFSRLDLGTLGQVTRMSLDMRDASSVSLSINTDSPCKSDFRNSSAVCISEKPVKCRKGTEFFEPKRGYLNIRYGDDWNSDPDVNLSLSDCHGKCWRNCSCGAYQPLRRDDTGCQFWSKGSEFTPNDNFEKLYILSHGNSGGKRT